MFMYYWDKTLAALGQEGKRRVEGSDGAAFTAVVDPTTGLPLGISNGGLPVSNVNEPARDLFLGWFFGSDNVFYTFPLAATKYSGLFQDFSLYNPGARQIVIINGNGATGCDFSGTVEFSRNGIGDATLDSYEVSSLAIAAGAKGAITVLPIPASAGYDNFIRLNLTATAGQTANQLKFRAYLTGRGG
jgi:hypothetical protein